MAKAILRKGTRVKLTLLAWSRNLGYGFRRSMPGTITKITETRYGLAGRYPKKGIRIPLISRQKRYWVKLDTPPERLRKTGKQTWGFFRDEIKKA